MTTSAIQSSKDWMRLVFCGLCMGIADVIPGISGSTIAFIMGFYARIIESIKSFNGLAFKHLFRGEIKLFLRITEWKFLLGLLTGVSLAFIFLAPVLHFILNHEIYRSILYSGFIGLVLAAAFLCGSQIQQWKANDCLIFVVGFCLAFVFSGKDLFNKPAETYQVAFHSSNILTDNDKSLHNYDAAHQKLKNVDVATISLMLNRGIIQDDTEVLNQLTGKSLSAAQVAVSMPFSMINLWAVFCGMMAICAMLLPGISGSYLLVILGMYAPAIEALQDLIESVKHLTLDSRAFTLLANLGVGVLLGGLIFSRFISWLLRNYHDKAIALLTGFMLGAVKALWPFWSYLYEVDPLRLHKGIKLVLHEPILPEARSPVFLISLAIALLGMLIVFALQRYARVRPKVQ